MDEQDVPNNTAPGIPSSDREPAEKEMPEQASLNPSPDQNERLAHFIQMLTDDNEGNRWKAAEMLGRMGDAEAVEPLIETLWDEDSRVRLKAAWALGQIGDPRAIRPLQRLYRIEKEGVQEIIAEALEEIKHRMSLE